MPLHRQIRHRFQRPGGIIRLRAPKRISTDDEARRKFFEAFNAEYAELQADPEAWEQVLEERRVWDVTLLDGLEDE